MSEISRFSYQLFRKLAKLIRAKIPHIIHVIDMGIIRFDDGKLNSIYIEVFFKDMHVGLVKLDCKEDDWVINSVYYTVSHELELRYDLEGNLLYKYITYKDGDKDVIVKIKDDKELDKYIIDTSLEKEFPKLLEQLREKKLIDKPDKVFKYFTKNKNVTYLQIR